MASKFLFAASEIGLFEALASGPATLGELASKTGVPSRTLGIVAAGMVSLNFIEKVLPMSAFGGKANIARGITECPLLAQSGHATRANRALALMLRRQLFKKGG